MPARADLRYWDVNGSLAGSGIVSGSGGPTGTWNTTQSRWSANPAGTSATAPWRNDGAETAVFSAGTDGAGAYTITIDTALVAESLRVEDGTPTFARSPAGASLLTFSTGVLDVVTGRTARVVNPLSLGAPLTKVGGGTMVLGDSVTYAGATHVNDGTLSLDFNSASAPANDIVPVTSPLELSIAGLAQSAALAMSGSSSAATAQSFAGTTISNATPAVVTAIRQPGFGATLMLGAITRGDGSVFTLVQPAPGGAGTVIISNTNVNGILGGWATVGPGQTVNGITYGTTFATVDGNGVIGAYTGYADFATGTVMNDTVTPATNFRVTGTSSGNVVVDEDNAGTTTDVNTVNIASGSRTIVIGPGNTLRLGKYGAILRSNTASGNDYTIGSAGQNVGTLTAGGAPNVSGEIVFNVNNLSQTSGSVIVRAAVADNGTAPVSVIKAGPGSLQVLGHNSYSGGTYILQGRYQLAGNEIGTPNHDGFGAGPVHVRTGGQAYLSGIGTTGMANAFFIAGVGTNAEPFGAVRLGTLTSANKVSGVMTLMADARIVGDSLLSSTNPTATFAGRITGPYALEVGTSATSFGIFDGSALTLSNPANDWTGDTVILSPSVQNSLYSRLRLGASNVIPDGPGKGNLVCGGFRSSLDLFGFNETINGLVTPTGGPAIVENRFTGTTSTLTVGNNDATADFWGIIQDNGGKVALTKIGAGTQRLNGLNTYTGATNVNGGILALGGNGGLTATSIVSVTDGAAFDLGGRSIGRPFSITGPGPDGAGALRNSSGGPTVSGSVTLTGDTTIAANTGADITASAAFVGGSHALTKIGAGRLFISGPQSWQTGASLTVDAGSLILNSNAGAVFPRKLAVNAAGGNATFNQSQSLAALTVGAGRTVTLSANASRVIDTDSLTIGGAGATLGKLDLKDNKLIVAGGEVGAWSGTSYDGVTKHIASAHNGGSWNGAGLTTSIPDAVTGLTSLAIATADQAGYAGGTFGGVSVSGDDVLVMYTYAGDANLDGFISGDDYAAIDFNVAVPGANGWYNGDFNYDGIISGDDYAAIDFNIVAQGAPFPTSTGISGVTAVPEPVGTLALLAGCLALRRRARGTAGRCS